ncbi:MAG TPA: hypothetical protein PLY26_13305, partial [Ferruginibacter sp.]|nr:hypothetical protein [Ferruginibacter sp.]
ENAVLQASEGIDIQEASNINLKNITMISKNTRPVGYVLNSDSIRIDGLRFKDSAEVLLQVQGERSKDIQLLNSNTAAAKQKLIAGFGAGEAIVSWALPVATEPAKKTKSKKKQ